MNGVSISKVSSRSAGFAILAGAHILIEGKNNRSRTENTAQTVTRTAVLFIGCRLICWCHKQYGLTVDRRVLHKPLPRKMKAHAARGVLRGVGWSASPDGTALRSVSRPDLAQGCGVKWPGQMRVGLS